MSAFLKRLSLLFTVFILAGCEGDPGSPGIDRLPEDLQPPSVELTLPPARAQVYAETVLEAHTYDDSRIEKVQFILDSRWDSSAVMTAWEPPWRQVGNFQNLSYGSHFIQAVAWDKSGKSGYSSLVMVFKVPQDSIISEDTIRFYDPASQGDISWRLPDNLNRFTGYGTRFSLNRPARLMRIHVRFYKAASWRGLELQTEIRSSKLGKPDSLLSGFIFNGTRMRIDEGVTTLWYRIKSDLNVDVPTEFFVLITKAAETTGDTLAVMSDEGVWRNWHGWVQEDGFWREFTAGQRLAFNPLIYCVMEN